jgi:signal transduction histidine kinase
VRPERVSLRRLIGGRWAVSWQGYLLAWPWAVLFIFSASPTVWDTGTLAERIATGVIVGTIAYIPVGVVAWLASITILRSRRTAPVPIALVALVGGIAWTTRSLALIGYLEVADVPSDASPALRLFAGFVQGAIAFVLTAWLLAKLTSFHEQRRRLLDTLVQDELTNERLHDRVQELQSRVIKQVRTAVNRTAQSLSTKSGVDTPTPSDVEVLVQATKRISKDLSRELWKDAAQAARVKPMTVARSAAANRPYAYWALLPGALLGVLVLPIYWAVQDALVAVSAVTLYALVISLLTNATCPRLGPSKALAAYIASIILLLATVFVMQAIIELLDLSPSGGSGLLWAVAVNFGVFYPLMGAGAHIGGAQQDVLAQLQRSISQAEIEHHALEREESHLRRELALALHGSLQADLTASTLRAQHAIDKGDSTTARAALDEARNLIAGTWDLPEATHANLQATVDAVIESWEGFVDISLNLDVDYEPNARIVAQIKEVLLEGIGNAVRHGQAKNIDISIARDEGDLRITIHDDGTGVIGSREGLGSAMFDDIAQSAWSLVQQEPRGSKLVVAIESTTHT